MTSETRTDGPTLDAEVAERVMGMDPSTFRYSCVQREWFGRPTFSGFGVDLTLVDAEARCARENTRNGAAFKPEPCNVPDYSTDIGAAWLVVEARPAGVWTWDFHQQDNGDWYAGIKHGYCTSYSHVSHAIAATLPLAICRAALSAGEGAR
jgi:hypothetical protein